MPDDAAAPPGTRSAHARLAGLLDGIAIRDPGLAAERERLVAEIRTYVIPRLDDPAHQPVVAVTGPSGSGSSAIVNALVDAPLSPEGAVRPTTRLPVLVAAETSAQRLEADLRTLVPYATVERIDGGITAGSALLDVPAGGATDEVLGLADLCLVVVSRGRYADAAAWEQVSAMVEKGQAVTLVLNRSGDDEVAADLRRRVEDTGVPAEVAVIGERNPLPPGIDALAAYIDYFGVQGVAAALDRRSASVASRAVSLAGELADLSASERDLLAAVDTGYGPAVATAQELVTPQGLGPEALNRPWPHVVEDIVGVVTHEAGLAAQRTASIWSSHALGAALLRHDGVVLWRHDAATDAAVRTGLLDWPGTVDDLVAGSARRRLDDRRRDDIARVVRRRVLGGEGRLRWWTRRKLRIPVDTLVDHAGVSLVAVVANVLATDAERFRSRLGPIMPSQHIDEIAGLASRLAATGVTTETSPGDDGRGRAADA